MRTRTLFWTTLVALCAVVLAPLGVRVAAAEAYLFWGYYQWSDSDDQWVFSSTGAEGYVPADGAVEGWRFAASSEDTTRFPRADGDFGLLCGSTPASGDDKRVGVVIDYGVGEEAPQDATAPAARGACAVIAQDATGADALAAVARVRLEGGFVCGIDSFPELGCGEPTDVEPTPGPEAAITLQLPEAGAGTADDVIEREGPGGITAVLIAGAALVVLIVLGGLLGRRRS